MPNTMNFRKEILNEVLPYARKDERMMLIVCDMGFGAVDDFRDEFPHRVFNFGMMEQGTVGIAAGMAMTGLIPIVYSIVNFLCYRSLEQIRNDVVLSAQNVKFIATGVNDYFKFLGASHCCGQDDKKIMDLIRMPVFDPYEKADIDFSGMVDEWITSERCGYMRV